MRSGPLLALIGLAACGPAATAPAAAAGHTVVIEAMRFEPAVLTVRRGERVVWVNRDLFPHTVTATGKAFDSGEIAAGGSWSFLARKRGAYAYGCTLHPTMKGQLIVR